ncbi:MAG: glycosyltransferase [Woeseiaceae bacterium]|nr:glycosyltransferase [Woeseiaceae bacterium]
MELSPTVRAAKVGVTTYPTSLQNQGGLQVHIKETVLALKQLGIDVEIADPYHENLSKYDLIHHFSLNHASFRILRVAKSYGVKCVATPMVEPIHSDWRIRKIRWVTKGMHRLFGNEFRNRWQDTLDGLSIADAITPITDNEGENIRKLVPAVADRIHVIPNGVTELFFSASSEAGGDELDLPHEPFVLLPSSIQPYKNQLPVVRAARRLGYQTVLVGPIYNQAYFQSCLDAGGENVLYAGVLDYFSPALARLFASAGIVVLASKIEPFGLVPFEALAAGTPSVLTRASGLKTPANPPYFQRVDPNDEQEIADVLRIGISAPRNRDACRNMVEDMRWLNVGRQLCSVYDSVLAQGDRAPDRIAL